MSDTKGARRAEILLIEDNPADATLIRVCLKTSGVAHRLSMVEGGEAALAFLRRQGPYPHAPRPDIILVDRHLPAGRGRALLREVKADARRRVIPVVSYSSPVHADNVARGYDHYGHAYVPKGMSYERCRQLVLKVEYAWLKIVRRAEEE